MLILITQAVSSICNSTRTHTQKRLTLFSIYSLWLTSGNPRPPRTYARCASAYARVCVRSRLSLFVTITGDVTGANNVIPFRTPSHSAHPSLSSLRAISHLVVPLFLSSACSHVNIRAPTRFFLHSVVPVGSFAALFTEYCKFFVFNFFPDISFIVLSSFNNV